jgi:RHS repeat-associated protein
MRKQLTRAAFYLGLVAVVACDGGGESSQHRPHRNNGGEAGDAGADATASTGGGGGQDGGRRGQTQAPDGAAPGIPSPDGGKPDAGPSAPPLDTTVTSDFARAFHFLFDGPLATQTGVKSGAIDDRRIAILRGAVDDANGDPVSGAKVTAPEHAEYGSTLTKADGSFDFVVNGGGPVRIHVEADGYLPVDREQTPEWRSFEPLRPIFLTKLDAKVTSVALGDGTDAAVVQGSDAVDRSGERTPALLFPAGTSAKLVLPNGKKRSLDTAHVRITEYTIGDNGPKAMPAPLPPQSGYTYAVEITVDEAEKAGATTVELSKPVPYYVENFLKFPVGEPVPAGSYDKSTGQWMTEPSGRVVSVIDVANGRATLDIDGDGKADDAKALSALGIDDAELDSVGARYTKGATLWRIPLGHFSTWDFNWCFFGRLTSALSHLFGGTDPRDDDCTASGSLIECGNQILGDSVAVAGVPARLHYRSDRVPGRREAFLFDLGLTNDPAPPKAKRVRVEMELLGRHITYAADSAADLSYHFEWDGLDGYGRKWQGPAPVRYRVGYVYDGWYGHTPVFGAYGEDQGWAPVPDSGIAPAAGFTPEDELARHETTMWLGWQSTTLGIFDAADLGFGGFTLGMHHAYDPSSRTLYLGTGDRRHANSSRDAVHAIIGDVKSSGAATGDPLGVSLWGPHGLALSDDGTLYVSDELNNRVIRLTTSGKVELVAGTGTADYTGDGGPATSATLNQPLGIALANDGTLYIAERVNQVVRRVHPDGTIDTFAGHGSPAEGNGDGGQAKDATFGEPHAIAIGQDGTIFIADAQFPAVRRVGTDGVIQTVLGNGRSGSSGDGGPGTKAQIVDPLGLAIGPDGSLYVADFHDARVRRLSTDGIVSTAAGTGTAGDSGDGAAATAAQLNAPHTIDVGPDGSIYIADEGNHRVRKVTPDGVIHALAGGGTQRAAEFVPAEDAKFNAPRVVLLEHDGRLLIADYSDDLVYRLVPFLPSPDPNGYTIAAANGAEYYAFDDAGRHLKTVDAVTGQTRFTFGYDGSGRLSTVTDSNGQKTTIDRDDGGRAEKITSPDGMLTTLGYASNGWLSSVSNAAGEKQSYDLNDDGLLASESDGAGRTHLFEFDDVGRLSKDTSPSGSFQALSRSKDHLSVTRTTARGLAYVYGERTLDDGQQESTLTVPDGRRATTTATPGHDMTTHLDGTKTEVVYSADPRFGLAAKYPTSTTLTTPGGLHVKYGATRTVKLADSEDPSSIQSVQSTGTVNSATITTSTFDVAKNTRTVTRFGQNTVYKYDGKGRVSEVDPPNMAPVSLAYDSTGRISSVAQKDRTSSFTYDEHGFLTKSEGPLGTTKVSFDAVGRLVSADDASTATTYDASGKLLSLVTPLGNEHGFEYDTGGRPAAYVAPSLSKKTSSKTAYGYGADDLLESVTFPSGNMLARTVDDKGRTTAWQTAEGTIEVDYDGTSGHVASMSTMDESIAYAWDGPLLLSTKFDGVVSGTVERTYGDTLRLSSEVVDGDALAFSYDGYGRPTNAGVESISYGVDGAHVSRTSIAKTTENFAYSSDYGELSQHTLGNSGATILYSATFTRDAAGRITKLDETVQGKATTQSFEYDDLGRLTAVTRGSDTTQFEYDADGNRVDTGGAVDAQDRLVSTSDASLVYDADGRLASLTRGQTTTSLHYDTLGRLKRADVPGHRIDYVVDPLGHRVGKKVDGALLSGFLYDLHGRIIAELDGSGAVVSRFVYGARSNVPDYMVRDGVTYRIFADHLGSVRLVLDASTSNVVEAIDYDAWGNVLSDSQPGFQPFGFAGGLYDADTGLVHFGARDYDARIGRWTAKDPILFRGGQLNLYAYAGNDPVNHVDPSGQCVTGGGISPLALLTLGLAAAIIAPELLALAEAAEAAEGLALAAEGAEAAEGLGLAAEGAAEGVGLATEGAEAAEASAAATGDDIAVIGRQADTAVANDWAGHDVLDVPDWTLAKNDAWVQSVIDRNGSVYIASPQTEANLYDAVAGRPTVFSREIEQFLEAGYRQVGDYLIPPP